MEMNGWKQNTKKVDANDARAARDVAACRAILSKHWMILVHMVMVMVNTGANANKGSRHGVMAEAGEQGMARQMRNSKYSTTGRQVKLAGLWSRSVWVWRECGGAGRSEHGLGPTLLSPPNLSPLPVSVHTHSLNLQQENNHIFFISIIPSP